MQDRREQQLERQSKGHLPTLITPILNPLTPYLLVFESESVIWLPAVLVVDIIFWIHMGSHFSLRLLDG